MAKKILEEMILPKNMDGELVSIIEKLKNGELALFDLCTGLQILVNDHQRRVPEHGRTIRDLTLGAEHMNSKIGTLGDHLDDAEKKIQDLELSVASSKIAKIYVMQICLTGAAVFTAIFTFLYKLVNH